MEPRPARETQAALIRWMAITDANSAGFVHGGTVMKLCDEAAGIAAIKHCRTRVVTAAIDRMTFRHPVHVGELLTCRATVGQVGNTDHSNQSSGKAGRSRWLGKRPSVRGTAMNPVDHPHGGGEGKSKGHHPVTPWGVPTIGKRTRRKHKESDKLIVRGRRRGKERR